METWILLVYILIGSTSTVAPRAMGATSTEFGNQESCQAALQTIKAADAMGVNIISGGCYKSGFVYKEGIRTPKADK